MLPRRAKPAPLGWAIGTLPIVAVVCLVGVGCMQSETEIDPQVLAEYRASFLLEEEPENVQAVIDVRESFSGHQSPDQQQPSDQNEDSHDHSNEDGDADADTTAADAEEVIEFTAEDVEPEPLQANLASMEPRDVVVVGQIGGMPNPFGDSEPDFPWKQDSATFFIVDPGTIAELSDSGHSHEEACDCPFCARHAADHATSVAIVNLVDNAGEPIDIPADELLGLHEQNMVVVRGQARMMGGQVLVVDADGVYVRH